MAVSGNKPFAKSLLRVGKKVIGDNWLAQNNRENRSSRRRRPEMRNFFFFFFFFACQYKRVPYFCCVPQLSVVLSRLADVSGSAFVAIGHRVHRCNDVMGSADPI